MVRDVENLDPNFRFEVQVKFLHRPDVPEPSRSGPLPDGPRNGPNRPGPFRAPKSSKFDHALNSKTIRIRPPPEPENLAPRSGPPGTFDLDLPTDPLEELPSVYNFRSYVSGGPFKT